MKVFQIVGGMCHWCTPFKSVGETIGKFPEDCLFVEAPDYVHESWGYRGDKDDNGNELPLEDRFIKPTPPEGWLYDDETGTFYPEEEVGVRVEKAQASKQNENKIEFAKYLSEHPLTWIDGKQYGVTMEDQTEIQLNISQYQIQIQAGLENPVLEWHSIHEKCEPWTIENLSALTLAIAEYVYPVFQKMNKYKEKIFAATSVADVNAISIIYTEETVKNADAPKTETPELSK